MMNKNVSSLTVSQALTLLDKRECSSVEITKSCLETINAYDKQINAYVTLNEQALQQAAAADKLRQHSPARKPLLGIPIAVKDNFLTRNLRTTASSKVLDTFIPPYTATVVEKLESAGAIIIGKTNMDAWAHGSSTETSDFGPTKNPWNKDFAPGGSSGGSAAAVAADFCLAAIGTETAGSVRQPAAWCGVTGFKPTYGRVSRYGVIAMASSTDSPGPITKNVEDALILLNVMAGQDPYDATTIPTPFSMPLHEIRSEMKDLVVGLPPAYLLSEMNPAVKDVILAAAREFERMGALVKPVTLIDPHYAMGVYTILQRSEVSSNLARFDGVRYGHNRTYFGNEAKRRIMLGTFSLSTGYYDQYYKKAQKVRTVIVNDFNHCFNECDVIIGPTSPGPALPLGAASNQPMFGEMQDILVEASSIAGLTGISVPCGFVDGLPIGLQITGAQQTEKKVLQAAYAYQQATKWHLKHPHV